jgi:hypothetical protein
MNATLHFSGFHPSSSFLAIRATVSPLVSPVGLACAEVLESGYGQKAWERLEDYCRRLADGRVPLRCVGLNLLNRLTELLLDAWRHSGLLKESNKGRERGRRVW